MADIFLCCEVLTFCLKKKKTMQNLFVKDTQFYMLEIRVYNVKKTYYFLWTILFDCTLK